MRNMIFVILMASTTAVNAAEYYVDWPSSPNPKFHLLVITVGTCKTEFKIPIDQLSDFANNDDALNDAVKIAEGRHENGCKN